MIENSIYYLFFISLILQFVFFYFVFRKLATYQGTDLDCSNDQPVSVIVCAHNEKSNLEELLPLLLTQNFQHYEIIVVDDRSEDGSIDFLKQLANEHSNLHPIRINEVDPELSPKKHALTNGILHASYPVLLLTDADCRPCSTMWIKRMTNQIRGGKEVCIGYSPYQKEKGILNLMIRFETFYTAIQYFSLALAGSPYMGVGRNLAYTKALFVRNQGFNHHKTIWSGDDDLFGNQTFKKENLTIAISSDSHVLSKPKTNYKDWFYQKSRHLSAGLHYKANIKFILGLLFFSQCTFYLTLAGITIWIGISLPMIIGFIFRTLLIIYIFVPISKKLHERFPWYWLLVLDFLYLLSYILFGLNSILSKNSKWT